MSSRPANPGAAPASGGDRPNKDLSQVNEKLRELIANLKSARERHEGGAPSEGHKTPPPIAPAAAASPAGISEGELGRLREALAHATAERDDLQGRLGRLEEEVSRISDDYVLVQEQTSEMAQLYVALERLHGGLSREETLQAIQEIVINVVGSEEFGVFEQQGDRLHLIHHFGVDPVPLRELKVGEGVIGRAAQKARVFVAGRDGPVDAQDADVTAAVPLMVGDKVWGVVVVFRLLGHKPLLVESDQVVFELLRSHAGIALSLRPAGTPANA